MIAQIVGQSGAAVGVTCASILSQTLVIAGGFYKTVNFSPLAWLSAINGIRYGFTAVARLYFTHTDSVWVLPGRTLAVRGYTWTSLEMLGSFTTLRTRGATIVDSEYERTDRLKLDE